MYKCGWNGCEKAYGTLNHLNAHVTMQSHGQKSTPEGESTVFVFDKNDGADSLVVQDRAAFFGGSAHYPDQPYASVETRLVEPGNTST